jgi:hypothetical protein
LAGKKMQEVIRLTMGLILTAATGCASTLCPAIYDVYYLPQAEINIDGSLDEPDWKKAHCERDFSFPWEAKAAPTTEFRSLFDDEFFYFSFRVQDEDVIVEKKFDAEAVVDREDRVEIFFARDDNLEEYFCLEVDALGRVHDYSASYYRNFDSSWDCPGIRTAGSITKQGYSVEGSIPIKTLKSLGLLFPSFGHVLKAGLFRAEFNHGPESAPEAHWISWIEPATEQPDFHVPSAFGCLRMAK